MNDTTDAQDHTMRDEESGEAEEMQDAEEMEQEEEEIEVEEGEEDDDDDDDPIVKRYDVFLSHNITKNLYLFQYPLRTPIQPYDLNTLREMKFRPKSKRVDMTFEMNTQSEHYDYDRAELQANHNTYSLTSTNVPLKANFAIGVMRGNQLHMTPLQDILQLRPDFSHLSKDPNVRDLEDTEEAKEQKKRTSNGPTAVHATIRTKEQEARMKKSYEYIKRQEEEETPINLHMLDNKSIEAAQAFDKLFEDSFNPVEFDMTTKSYLDTLVPYKADPLAKLKGRQLSLESLGRLPFEQQVTVAMFVAQVLHFERLKKLATRSPGDTQLLEVLGKVAIIVDGRWVVKSQILFNQDNFLASCRDYLLYLLHTQHYVKRMEFMHNTKLNSEMTNKLLENVAILEKERRVWVLKLPRDEVMCTRYPEFVQRHEDEWRIREKVVKNNLAHNFTNVLSQQLQQQQMLRTPVGASSASRASSSESSRRTVGATKAEQRMGPPPPTITQAQPISGKPIPTLSVYVNPSTLKGVIGLFVKSQFDSFGVCQLSLLEKRFKNSQSEMLVNMSLEQRQQFSTLSDQGKLDLLHELLEHLTRSFDNVGIPLPDGKQKNKEKCFVLHNPYLIPTDARQPIRDAVIELLEKKIKEYREKSRSKRPVKITQRQVIDYVREKTGTNIKPGDFSKIMQELCVQHDGEWVPKAGTEKG